jgi:hypothetical protein
MDRHNMMLFLLQDTLREYPVGFGKRGRNLFDPAEDDGTPDSTNEKSEGTESPPKTTKNALGDADVVSGEAETNVVSGEAETNDDESKNMKQNKACSRSGCSQKTRFDSLFCSDACGVSALESDLLRTFQYASDIHPSLLRN